MFKVKNKNDKLITRIHTKLSKKTAEKYYYQSINLFISQIVN